MRRWNALLIVAGLLAAPASVAAGTCSIVRPDHGEIDTAAGARLGISTLELTPELRWYFGSDSTRGVLVARVDPVSPASLAGVRPGDVVVEIDGQPVLDPPDIRARLASVPGPREVELKLMRDRRPVELSVHLQADGGPGVDRDWLSELVRPLAVHGNAARSGK